ncbi:MAG: hypothetical protein DLM58_15185 [Pseudonocardiales bacterium]|nr:MAG: hypothetical protein DLM58_15185 [Pseudonocardiales bacterium]
MFDSDSDHADAVSLAALEDAVTSLIGRAQASPTGAASLRLLQGLETQHNRLALASHALIAELEAQGVAHEYACRSTSTLLSQVMRLSPNQAALRVQAAADLGPRRAFTGEALPPLFAQVAEAQASGALSPAHARVITRTIDALPAAVQAEHAESVQASLVEHAHTLNPRQLATAARRISDYLDPDGTLANERDRQRRRELTIRPRPDGSARIEGELSALCAEALRSVLDTLARPVPAQDGSKDPRSTGQRNHDGLHDALMMLLRTDLLPQCNGVAATIVLTMTREQFDTKQGLVQTGHGALISSELALTLASDARVIPVALSQTREIAGYGTSHRIFTEGQRLAMIARDQGCSFPACEQPPARCQAHHITDWALTQRTSVDDGTLLCGYHHREHPNLGWSGHMINGIPHWAPPPWVDPTQTPRRNRVHDLLPV